MNFAREVVDAAPRDRLALVALGADGTRREISFGEVADRSARLASTLAASGTGRGEVVMTVAGSRHARAATNAASRIVGYPRFGILFRPPAGLADGLALKELARPLLRGDSPLNLGPPFRW